MKVTDYFVTLDYRDSEVDDYKARYGEPDYNDGYTNTGVVACSRNGNVIYDYKLRNPDANLARIIMNDLEDAGALD